MRMTKIRRVQVVWPRDRPAGCSPPLCPARAFRDVREGADDRSKDGWGELPGGG